MHTFAASPSPSFEPGTPFSNLSSSTLVEQSPAFPFGAPPSPLFAPNDTQPKSPSMLFAPHQLATRRRSASDVSRCELPKRAFTPMSFESTHSFHRAPASSAAEKWEALLAAAATHVEGSAAQVKDSERRPCPPRSDEPVDISPRLDETKHASIGDTMKADFPTEAKKNRRRGIIMI